MKKVRMLLFVPHEKPKFIRIDNEHSAISSVLKEYNNDFYGAHVLSIEKNIYIIYPRLEDILEYSGTRKYNDNIICGAFLITKTDDFGFITSLDYRNMLKYAHKLWDNKNYEYLDCIQSYFNLASKELDDIELE